MSGRLPMHSQLVYDYADTVYAWVQNKGAIQNDFGDLADCLAHVTKMARPQK